MKTLVLGVLLAGERDCSRADVNRFLVQSQAVRHSIVANAEAFFENWTA